MEPDQPLISVSVIDQASMTSVTYASAPNDCNGGAFAICAYGNYIYAAFFNSETDVSEIAQYELTTGSSPTPTPTATPGGVLPGYPFPLTSPSPVPTQSNQSSPSPTQSRLNSGVLLLIIVFIAVVVAITLVLSRPRKHRKH
jgi:hypothetical protein